VGLEDEKPDAVNAMIDYFYTRDFGAMTSAKETSEAEIMLDAEAHQVADNYLVDQPAHGRRQRALRHEGNKAFRHPRVRPSYACCL